MPLIVIPLTINTLTGFMLWQTELSLTAKIIVTVLIVLKYGAFFYGALMADACGASKYISLGLCAAINIGLVIYTLVTSQWTVTIGIAITLLLLIIWSLPMIFISKEKEGNEQ